MALLLLFFEAGSFLPFKLLGGGLVVLRVLALGRGLATLGALSLLLSAFLLCELTLLNLRVLNTDTAQLDFVTEQALRSFILHQEHKSVTVISTAAFTYGLNLLLPGLGQGVNTHDAHRHLRGVERPTHS